MYIVACISDPFFSGWRGAFISALDLDAHHCGVHEKYITNPYVDLCCIFVVLRVTVMEHILAWGYGGAQDLQIHSNTPAERAKSVRTKYPFIWTAQRGLQHQHARGEVLCSKYQCIFVVF